MNYFYSAEPEALAEIRPIHREWLRGLYEAGTLLASGPMVDNPGALLIIKAESVEAVGNLLDNDPFDIAGFIGERVVTQWNPVFGPWVS
ncbi:MAG: hypothetical protein RL488_208 [Actinomycetota bacterium]